MGQFGPFSPLPEEIQFLSGGNRRRHSPRTVAHSALPHATMQNQACDRAMSDRLLVLLCYKLDTFCSGSCRLNQAM